VFLVNSRFPLLSAAIPRSTRKGASRVRPPFSLSYGGNLPSSLTTVHPSPRYSLPDHLCRFGVRAAKNSLEAFLGSIGSLTSPESARHHVSASMVCGFAYTPAYTLTPAQPPAGLSYLPASPHRLTTTIQVPAHQPVHPKDPSRRAVSTERFVMGALSRVREYQPVVHRLRLSASP
jgi:hypothetical protein